MHFEQVRTLTELVEQLKEQLNETTKENSLLRESYLNIHLELKVIILH